MSDNKKYYYMKLKETFFDSEEMKILESHKNGIEYQNLYLKLCLLSLKHDGKVAFKGHIPYDCSMLSTIVRVNIDTVKTGIEIFQRMGLLELFDTGIIYMNDIQLLVGKSSTEAERIKEYRLKLEHEKTKDVQMYNKNTPELEIELKKEKELDIYKKKKEPHQRYGIYKHILLTDNQYNKLKAEVPDYEKWIKEVDEGIEMKGYHYTNFYLAILNWIKRNKTFDKKSKVVNNKACPICGAHTDENNKCPRCDDV